MARSKNGNKKPPVKYHSITFEISFLYSLILGIILIIFSGVLYFILFRAVYTELDNELELTAVNVSSSIHSYLDVRGEEAEPLKFALGKTIEAEGRRPIRWWSRKFEKRWFKNIERMDLSDSFLNFISIKRASIARSPNMSEELIDLFREQADLSTPSQPTYQTINFASKKIRIINYPFTYKGVDKYFLQVGIYQQDIISLIFNWLTSVMISIPVILVLTSFIGKLFVKRILKPVEEIATIARKISHEDLTSRVQTKNIYTEVKYLIDDFNEMINRLEKSFTHIEEFSSHVAHELKTPLTIIKWETELALMEKRSMIEYKRAMKVNLEEVEKMLRIIDDLLLLSKIDYQPDIFLFEEFDFVAYFKEILSQSKSLAKKKSIKIISHLPEEEVAILGDKVHLRRVFFNIMDNALKFTPEKGHITVDVHSMIDHLEILIRDSGIGIAEEEIKKIFDRFYRCANSNVVGAGLGLSIAQSVVHLHKGSIDVKSQLNSGTTFYIRLPKA